MRRAWAGALVLLATSAAAARDSGSLMVGARAGAIFPQPFSPLGASFLCGAEVGWVAPFWSRHLAFAVDIAMSAPQASGAGMSASGAFSWRVVEREVTIGLYLFVRHAFGRVTPYLGGGPRLFVLDTLVGGASGGERFPPAHETTVTVGGGLLPGVGVGVRPGQVFLELPLAFAQATERTTGATSVSSVGVACGYRVLFR